MITFTRNQARQVRAVLRRALNVTRGGLSYPVTLETGPGGLRIWAKSPDTAVRYAAAGDYPAERLCMPFEFLADCEGRKDEPVQLEIQGDNRAVAGWRDGQVPQIVEYDLASCAKDQQLPRDPEALAQNEARLLPALRDASETADSDAVRYATNHLRLRGSDGSIAATDGRQLLVQSGFTFPWQEDVLIPRSTIFGCRDLPQDLPVALGKAGDWVTLAVGPWTIWLAVNKTGRFPGLERHVPRPVDARARCRLSAGDAQFLKQAIQRLPCDDEYNLPVTIDLNGSVAVRARGDRQSKPTELVLANSAWSGEPIRVNSNRRFLARALELGFGELCLYDPRSPILCGDEQRSYGWAPLDPDSAIAPTDGAICIVSNHTDVETHTSPNQHERKVKPMSRSRNGTNGKAAPTETSERTTAITANTDSSSLLDQARSVHEALREAVAKTGQLMTAIKQQEKRRRALQSTLASLRQLQSIEP